MCRCRHEVLLQASVVRDCVATDMVCRDVDSAGHVAWGRGIVGSEETANWRQEMNGWCISCRPNYERADRAEARVKELEAGVQKAMVRFCGEGSDRVAASEMMQILVEVIG